eukprot:11608799-Alexandrium_andersonii.AAC.1
MARCGFNPEGNVESRSSLQAAFEWLSEPALSWLSREEVRFAVRNQKAAVELMPAVRKTRRAGAFEVPSSQAGTSYTAEVED